MAWLRTAVSLIGFRFAIVQFFERMRPMPKPAPARIPNAPEYLGLALIACGVPSARARTRTPADQAATARQDCALHLSTWGTLRSGARV